MKLARLAFAVAIMITTGAAGCSGDGDGGGATVQLGPNLGAVPPGNLVTCADGYPVQINPGFPQPFTGQGAQSCLLVTFFPGAQPSTDGTVVSANLFVGAVTGPMRFVRARVLLQNPLGPACCSVEQFGEIFTPTPNTITTVPLGFAMTADHVPAPGDFTTIAAGDLIGLEVLSPTVPLPGNWTANGGAELALPNYAWFPALSARGLAVPTQNLRSEGSYSGFLPSYNIDFRAR